MSDKYEPTITPVKVDSWHTDSDKKYTIFYYTFWDFQRLMRYRMPERSKLRLFFTRGFTDGKIIYALDKEHWYSKIGHDELIFHEIGHIEGYKHSWLPDVMNPLWIFRWSRYHW